VEITVTEIDSFEFCSFFMSFVDKAKQAKQSCKKTGEGRGLYTHQMNMK